MVEKYCKRWNVPVPDYLDELLENYLQSSHSIYATKSEFVRAAVIEKLDRSKGYPSTLGEKEK